MGEMEPYVLKRNSQYQSKSAERFNLPRIFIVEDRDWDNFGCLIF
jgi:hypothetical protein